MTATLELVTGLLNSNVVETVPMAVEAAPSLENEGAAAIGAGLMVGLAALATGYAQRGIGSAAVGAVAEDSDNFTNALILTALPETLIIIALVVALLII